MKVYVECGMFVEVKDNIFKELKEIHESEDKVATEEQYAQAIEAIEKATGILFYDALRDECMNHSLRIIGVRDEECETPILEA